MPLSRRDFLATSAATVSLSVGSSTPLATGADKKKKLVMIAGTPSHGPGDHEFNAGVRLLEK